MLPVTPNGEPSPPALANVARELLTKQCGYHQVASAHHSDPGRSPL